MEPPFRSRSSGGLVFAWALFFAAGCGGTSSDPGASFPDAEPRKKDLGAALADAQMPVDTMDAGTPDTGPPPDSDGDGIPDVEDPAPNSSNSALFRDNFDGRDPAWLFTSDRIAVDAGSGLLSISIAPFVDEAWLGPEPTWGDVYVRSRIRVQKAGMSTEQGARRVGVIVRANQIAPKRYLFCGVDLQAQSIFVSQHEGGGPEGTVIASTPFPAQAGDWFSFGVTVEGRFLSCSVNGASISAESTLYSSGSAGIRTFDAELEADWFEVYEL